MFRARISTGASFAIHFEPCSADAARPVITPRRLVHSQAARVRCASVGSVDLGT